MILINSDSEDEQLLLNREVKVEPDDVAFVSGDTDDVAFVSGDKSAATGDPDDGDPGDGEPDESEPDKSEPDESEPDDGEPDEASDPDYVHDDTADGDDNDEDQDYEPPRKRLKQTHEMVRMEGHRKLVPSALKSKDTYRV